MLVLTLLFTTMFTMSPVFATDVENTVSNEIIVNTVEPIDNTVNNTVENTVVNTTENTVVNNVITEPGELVTFQDLIDRIVFKLNEILNGMKAIAMPVVMILFVASAVTAVMGAFSAKGTIWKGVWAMVTAAVVYSVITYADVIVGLFTSWMIS